MFRGSLYTAPVQSKGNISMFGLKHGSFGAATDTFLVSLSRISFYWPLSWRSLSAIILAVLLANWTWILFAPQATFTSAFPDRAAEIEAGQLFGVGTTNEVATPGVALPNVQLLGVFASSANKTGFAVLKLDSNRQLGVAEGEEVAPGTILMAVNADHILLERAGIQQRVNLEDKYAGSNKNVIPANGWNADDVQKRIRQLQK